MVYLAERCSGRARARHRQVHLIVDGKQRAAVVTHVKATGDIGFLTKSCLPQASPFVRHIETVTGMNNTRLVQDAEASFISTAAIQAR